jgi:hypothetical protein
MCRNMTIAALLTLSHYAQGDRRPMAGRSYPVVVEPDSEANSMSGPRHSETPSSNHVPRISSYSCSLVAGFIFQSIVQTNNPLSAEP